LAGLPIIARLNAGTDLSTLIHNAQAGFSIEGEDSYTLMQQKVELMIANPVLYKDMSKNALRLAKDMFDPKHTVQKIIQSTTDKTS